MKWLQVASEAVRSFVRSFSSVYLFFCSALLQPRCCSFRWLTSVGDVWFLCGNQQNRRAHSLSGKRKKQYSNYIVSCELWSVDLWWNMQISFLCCAEISTCTTHSFIFFLFITHALTFFQHRFSSVSFGFLLSSESLPLFFAFTGCNNNKILQNHRVFDCDIECRTFTVSNT